MNHVNKQIMTFRRAPERFPSSLAAFSVTIPLSSSFICLAVMSLALYLQVKNESIICRCLFTSINACFMDSI